MLVLLRIFLILRSGGTWRRHAGAMCAGYSTRLPSLRAVNVRGLPSSIGECAVHSIECAWLGMLMLYSPTVPAMAEA